MAIHSGATLCSGVANELGDDLCPNADRFEWSQVAGPAASQVVFSNTDQAFTDITFPNPGRYRIRRCCYTNINDDVAIPDPVLAGDPQVVCPAAVVAGETFNVSLAGCEGQIVTWSSPNYTVIGIDDTSAVVTISATALGTGTVQATCEDADGNITGPFDCQITVYPQNQEFTETSFDPVCVEVVRCGENCQCETVDVIVIDCFEQPKTPLKVLIDFKDDLPAIPKPQVQSVTRVPLVGSPLVSSCNEYIEKACEKNICKELHKPVILFNDAYNCGWTIDATNGVSGTHPYNMLGYNTGLKFCFMGSTTITLSGPPLFIDIMALYGHNMIDAQISTSPLQDFGGNPVSVGVISDKACIDGYTVPAVIPFNDVQDNITSMTIDIVGADPNKIYCIDHLFLGRKFFTDPLPDDWKNPFLGSSREMRVRRGDCGVVSAISKRKETRLSIPIRCMCEEEYKECYLPLLRYIECNPVMYQYSINRCPTEVFYGYMEAVNEGGTYSEGFYVQNTIELVGHIRQRQPKDFV